MPDEKKKVTESTAGTAVGAALAPSVGQELTPTAQDARERYQMQSALTMAHHYPRDEQAATVALLALCDDPGYAEECLYQYPRGGQRDCDHVWSNLRCTKCSGTLIEGASVFLAREAARLWGNIYSSVKVLDDQEGYRHLRGIAWDLQLGSWREFEDDFAKLIWRKGRGESPGRWEVPDERELRELTNRRGAILERNCIFKVISSRVIQLAVERAKKAMLQDVKAQTKEGKLAAPLMEKMLQSFAWQGVTPGEIADFLGHSLERSAPEEIVALKNILTGMVDGTGTWPGRKQEAPKARTRPSEVRPAPQQGTLDREE
jgi:hypothetical protein